MLKNKPKNWREGQTVFNFLEWLKEKKNIHGNQNARLADTFHVQDEDMEKYWEEFMDEMDFKSN